MKAQKNNSISYFFLSFILLIGCIENVQTNKLENADVVATRIRYGDGELVVCDFASIKDTINIPLSTFVSELEIIRLENTEKALTDGGYTFFSENYIGIRGHNVPYKLYDKKGKFISDIGKKGQGPFEYSLGVYHSYIDEEEDNIYILPIMGNNIWVFNLSGEPKFAIPLPHMITKGRFYVDTENRELVVMNMPFPGTPYVIWKQDFNGNVIHDIRAREPFIIDPPDYSNEIGSEQCAGALDFHIDHYPGKQDSLYHYNCKTNRLQAVFTMIFTEKQLSEYQHIYTELSDYYLTYFNPPISRWGEPAKQIVIDKSSLHGAYFRLYNDFLGDIPYPVSMTYYCCNGYFVANIYPHELKKHLENAFAYSSYLDWEEDKKKKLRELYNDIDEDDNNFILLGKLK